MFAAIGVFWRPVPSIKVFAAFLIASLAVYANTWWTSLAAVFIIATTMTELEFLENLAAIIRGTPNFPYRVQPETTKEAQATAEARLSPDGPEVEARADATTDTVHEDPMFARIEAAARAMPRVDFYVVEQLGLSFLEKRLGESISRNVSLVGLDRGLSLDGLIQRTPPSPDTIIDLKFYDSRRKPAVDFSAFVQRSVRTLRDRTRTVEAGTGRLYTVILAVVVPQKDAVAHLLPALHDRVSQSDPRLRLEVIDFTEIGYHEPG